MRKATFRLLLCAAVSIAPLAAIARAQQFTGTTVETEAEVLSDKVNDPIAILTQLKFQDVYTPRNFQSTAQTNTIQLQSVLPVDPFSIIPVEQVVRPTLKIQTQAVGSSSRTITEFDDLQLFDLFISPWPDQAATSFGWALGPMFIFPTATASETGKEAWQLGPALAMEFRGVPRMRIGFLFQNPISYAYTSKSATSQNQMLFQPVISFRLGNGWYVKSADSTWTVNWRHQTSTTLPISLGFGRVWDWPSLKLDTWVSGEWTSYRQFAAITPMYSVRFGVTLLLPDFNL